MTSEAAFTPPRSDCPHPERWRAHDELSAEVEVGEFLAALVSLLHPDTVVETGTYHGHTAEAIAGALRRLDHGHLYTVEQDVEAAGIAAARLPVDRVTVVQGSSLAWKPPSLVDLLFLDANPSHRFEEVHHFWPFLHEGSVIAVHDTAVPGVREQAERLATVGFADPPLYLPTPRGLALTRARALPARGA